MLRVSYGLDAPGQVPLWVGGGRRRSSALRPSACHGADPAPCLPLRDRRKLDGVLAVASVEASTTLSLAPTHGGALIVTGWTRLNF